MKKICCVSLAATLLLCALAVGSKASSPTSASDLMQLLPDGAGVALVDVQRFLASPVWAEISNSERTKREIESLQSDLAEIGISLRDINSIALSFGNGGFKSPTVAVAGTFDRTALISKLQADTKVKVSTDTYRGIEITTVQSAVATSKSDPVSFAFFDSGTAVVGSKASVQASIDTKLGGRSIAQNTQLNEALNQNPDAVIRLAMSLTPEVSAKLQSTELPLPDFSSIKMIWASIDVSSGIDLSATLRNDTAEHAKAIADRLNSLISMVRGFIGASSDPKTAGIADALKSVTITESDIDVKINGSVSLELLKTFLMGKASAPVKKS